MARPFRFQDAGLWYDAANRGNNREDEFVGDEDCQRFLDVLGASAALFGGELHACVIMTNHHQRCAAGRCATGWTLELPYPPSSGPSAAA